MDQVRNILSILWQQRFWLLASIGVLIASLCWMLASSDIDAQYAKRKGEITQRVSAMTSLNGQAFHGNPGVNDKELERTRKIRESVRELWQALHDRQQETVLKWPDVLGEDFVNFFDPKKPNPVKFGDPIHWGQRDTYWTYIKNRFDGLLEIVQAKKAVGRLDGGRGGEAAGPYGRPGGFEGPGGAYPDAGEQDDYIVQWIDQGRVKAKLSFESRPRAMQIWVIQEDLWVYETLLRVIANVNASKGANRPDNAAIRAIVALEVGSEAAAAGATGGNLLIPSGGAGAMTGEGRGYGPGPGSGGRSEFGEYDRYGGGGGDADESAIDAALLTGRYVDAAGQPVDDPAASSEQFRRLPIHMSLVMDQRYLPETLVQCANAPLPVEVTRVLINPDKSGDGVSSALNSPGGVGGGGRGAYSGGGGYSPPSAGGRSEYGRGYSGGGATAGQASAVKGPGMVTIDIQGVVYIYQAPNDEVLSLPGDEELNNPGGVDDSLAATGSGIP